MHCAVLQNQEFPLVAFVKYHPQHNFCRADVIVDMLEDRMSLKVGRQLGKSFLHRLQRAKYFYFTTRNKIISKHNFSYFIAMNADIIRMMSDYQDSQEFLLREPSPYSQLTPQMIERYTKFHQFQYFTLFKVLSKAHSLRSHNQLKFLSDYLKKNPILKELSQINGSEYSRGLLRSASLQQYQAGSIVQQRESGVNKIYIILEGKLGTIKNLDQTDMIQEMSLRKTYQQLTQIARKQIKRFSKLARKLSSWRDNFQRHFKKKYKWEQAEYLEYYERYNTFADKIRCFGEVHTHTTVAVETSLLLTVDIKNAIYWLNHCFQTKLEVSFNLLRQLPCFTCLSDDILESVIGFLVVTKAAKGDIVYQQGSQPDKIYFLQQGQLKIEKASKLFIQNPNSLYLDRRKLMNNRQISNNEYLPYADLHLLYNYQPTLKNIQIGILTPCCLFGEEDIIESHPRETTVRCMALKNTYFSIQLKKLFQILGENTRIFIRSVEDSVRQKIKYRQYAYATSINIQNKRSLKYFFEGDSPQIAKNKKIIKKINEKINSQALQMQEKYKEQNEEQNKTIFIKEAVKNQRKSLNHQQVIPPSFNSFNFHHMLKTKLKPPSLKQSSSEGEEQLINAHMQALKEQNYQERKILNNSHTWRLIKAKVNKQKQLSRKMGSFKHKIDFSSPLIDQKHFQKIESEMKRIERDKKVRSFHLSTITKARDKSTSRSNMKSLNTIHTHR